MIPWDGALDLGYEPLDTQHKRLVEAANRVYEAHRDGSREDVLAHLRELITVSAAHFVFEEELMAETDYGKAHVHSEHHGEILAKLDRFTQNLASGRFAGDSEKVLAFLAAWIASHITGFDRDLAEHLASSRR